MLMEKIERRIRKMTESQKEKIRDAIRILLNLPGVCETEPKDKEDEDGKADKDV
jgi:hypothetical protein